MQKTVIIVALALTPVGLAHAQIPTEERDALIALYNATNGASWTPPTWDTATTGSECTTWKGVSCNAFDRVSQLELQYFNLDGSLPAELGDLENLIVLKLFGNPQLTGSIPRELGSLASLQYFEAFNCALTGSIPPELGNLSKLGHMRLYNNQLTGSIPPELGDLPMLRYLVLSGNQLSGSIPPELGNLDLRGLDLGFNQLSGSIPPELSNLTNLYGFDVEYNQLSGSIPSFLGSFSNLIILQLRFNRFTGAIPPELGDISTLQTLSLKSNMLSGEIPAELTKLTNTTERSVHWNALYTDDASVIAFVGTGALGTQTIAPENVTVGSVGDHTVWLSWDAVTYQIDPGGYEVFSSPTGSGVWTSGGWTESKTTTTYPVTGLDSGTTYDFAVVTYTDPHTFNQNLVNSDFSAQVMTATTNTGCSQPEIDIVGTGLGPFTLSLTESFDSYAWSTAETTSSIVAGPPYGQWYWVTVTSAGPCEETAAAYIQPTIFTDDFETGYFANWSSVVP